MSLETAVPAQDPVLIQAVEETQRLVQSMSNEQLRAYLATGGCQLPDPHSTAQVNAILTLCLCIDDYVTSNAIPTPALSIAFSHDPMTNARLIEMCVHVADQPTTKFVACVQQDGSYRYLEEATLVSVAPVTAECF